MMRLIDADALRDKLQAEIDKVNPPFDGVLGSIRCGVRLARNMVEDEPTVDVEPVRHGHWYDEPNYLGTSRTMYFCSYCGSASWREDPYCWHCGSKMDVSDTDVGKMDETCN